MAKYSQNKYNDVESVINSSTKEYLERFIQADAFNIAKEKMDAEASAQEVGDAVYDFLYENHSDSNPAVANSLMQVAPKDLLFLLRFEIIQALK